MQKTDITVRELVDKVRRGELTLPEMQRRYVWPATRVRDLLDSLYRGYPSGVILTWETDENIETHEMAVRATAAPTTTQKLLLLDGQQRITSLSAILSGEKVHIRNKSKPIDILFNLDHPEGVLTEVIEVDENDINHDIEDEDEEAVERDIQEEFKKKTFVVTSRMLQNNPLWVPVSDIFVKTDRDILKPIGINSDDERWDKYSERLQKVRQIANYPYVMQVLEKSMSYEEVTEIFVRVNSLGVKLRGSDLALAQITSRWPGFMKLIEDFSDEFNDDAQYIIESNIPVRALVVFATKQSKFKTVGKISLEELKNNWDKAKEALRFAINFLRSNAGIDNLEFLSSPFLLIPIAVYFNLKNGQISPSETNALLRWFYLAHMRGHYSMGSSESILDADVSVMYRSSSLNELLAVLEQHVKRIVVSSDDLINRGIRSPFFSMLYFVLKQEGAKDWTTGLSLSDKHTGSAHSIQYHHIFPKSLLRDANYDKKEINEMANMAFIGGKTNRYITNKQPIEYLEKEVLEKQGEDTLTSQLIPLDKSLWEIDNYKDFLVWRREKIAESINNFIGKLV
ncbi:DUF262 domain-containing protein [Candidatus Falkowbacteria bacterium]|nr:MAG: DUF262 domain-containing protein [Candidatus Falkowbacteria bacterium]